MSSRAEQLALRRRELQLRSARQRQEIIDFVEHIEERLAVFDRAIGAVRSVTKHPLVIVGLVAGTMMLGPWRALRWIGQGAMLFNVAMRVRRLMAH